MQPAIIDTRPATINRDEWTSVPEEIRQGIAGPQPGLAWARCPSDHRWIEVSEGALVPRRVVALMEGERPLLGYEAAVAEGVWAHLTA